MSLRIVLQGEPLVALARALAKLDGARGAARELGEALEPTERVCSSVNVASTRAGINMDAVLEMGRVIEAVAEENGGASSAAAVWTTADTTKTAAIALVLCGQRGFMASDCLQRATTVTR